MTDENKVTSKVKSALTKPKSKLNKDGLEPGKPVSPEAWREAITKQKKAK